MSTRTSATRSSAKSSKSNSTRIAAIDIGSNAIRLVLGEFDVYRDVRILKKVREPVRLGQDVFSEGMISRRTADRAFQTFAKFRTYLERTGVKHVRAVATSALREASNRDWFVKQVELKSRIKIDVIDGTEEARLIHSAVASRVDLDDKNALLIDIGGGSVELTISAHGRIKAVQTFKLGTVRLLQHLQDRGLKERQLREFLLGQIAPVRSFLQSSARGMKPEICIGTGGNLECLGKLRVALLNRNSIFSMTYDELGLLIDHLLSMSVKERIQFLRLRADRADVVVPAALVAQTVMGLVPVEILAIPYVGLRDGILADLAAHL